MNDVVDGAFPFAYVPCRLKDIGVEFWSAGEENAEDAFDEDAERAGANGLFVLWCIVRIKFGIV